jgi:DNA polymerase I-like protein with 3'-5' exonuclease and polymerase domains
VLQRQVKITKERGQRVDVALPQGNVAVVPTLRPSYVLHNASGDPRTGPECAALVADLKKALDIARGVTPALPKADYGLINSVAELKQFTEWLLAGYRAGKLPFGMIGVDVESDNLKVVDKNNHLASIQIAWAPGRARMILVAHQESEFTKTLESADILAKCVRAILAEIPVAGQTYRFDAKMQLMYLNAPTRYVAIDTALAHQHLRGGSEPNDLTYLTQKYLRRDAYEAAFNAAFEQYGGSSKMPLSVLVPYGCTDADHTLQVGAMMLTELHNTQIPAEYRQMVGATTMYETYVRLYGPAVFDALMRMEVYGIGVDMAKGAELAKTLPEIMAAQEHLVKTSAFYAAWREKLKAPNEKRWKLVRGTPQNRFQCSSCSKVETTAGTQRKCVCGQRMALVERTVIYPVTEKDCRDHPDAYRWDDSDPKAPRARELDPSQPEFVYPEPNLGSHDHVRTFVYDVMQCPPLKSMKAKNPRPTRDNSRCASTKYVEGESKQCVLSDTFTPQRVRVLHEDHHQYDIRKTHTTESEVLERIADLAAVSNLTAHAVVLNALLNWKKVEKLYGTYVKGLSELISNPRESRRDPASPGSVFAGLGRPYPEETIHTTFSQFPVTGRLASSGPNMQNNPRGSQTREIFVTRRLCARRVRRTGLMGHWDYKQAELRIMTMLTLDDAFAAALATSDPHLTTAVRMFGLDKDQVSDDKRTQAKQINFGVPYGRGAEAIGLQIGKPKEVAQGFIDDHRRAYPKTWAWIARQHDLVKRNGYIVIPSGRVIPAPEARSSDRRLVSEAERYAVNYPIQGGASDCGLVSLGELTRILVESYRSRLWGFTHDADDVDMEPSEFFEIAALVPKVMSEYPRSIFSWINLPMPVDFSFGVDDSRRLSVEKIEGERGEGSMTLKGPAPFWKPVLARLEETYSVSMTDEVKKKRVEVPKKGKDSRSVVTSSLTEDYDVMEARVHVRIKA